MPTSAEIIAAARDRKGTPFQHQGRLAGVGLDCAGLVLTVGEELGCVSSEHANRTAYGRNPKPIEMKAALGLMFDRVRIADMRPADIPWMRVAGEKAQHIGILSERNTLIHAIQNHDVQELPITSFVKHRIVAVYRYRGVTD